MKSSDSSLLQQKASDAAECSTFPPSADKSDCESVVSDLSYMSDRSTCTGIGGMQRYQLTDFVRQLVRGRPITLIKEVPYDPFVERYLATMRLSKDLLSLTISAADLTIKVALADITQVLIAQADGDEHFPKGIREHLSPGELDRLARVFHALPDGREMAFMFMEAGPKWLKLLPKALKALLKRAKRRGPEAGGPVTAGLTAATLQAVAPTRSSKMRRSASQEGRRWPRAA